MSDRIATEDYVDASVGGGGISSPFVRNAFINAWGVGNAGLTGGNIDYFAFWVEEETVVSRALFYQITGGSGGLHVGIYDDDGAGPDQRLCTTGAISHPGGGTQIVDVPDVTLAPGKYWVAVLPENNMGHTYHGLLVPTNGTDPQWWSEAGNYASGLPATAGGSFVNHTVKYGIMALGDV